MHFLVSSPFVWSRYAVISTASVFVLSAITSWFVSLNNAVPLSSVLEQAIFIASIGGSIATINYRNHFSLGFSHPDSIAEWALSVIWGSVFCLSSFIYGSIYNPLETVSHTYVEQFFASVGLGLVFSIIGVLPLAWFANGKKTSDDRP